MSFETICANCKRSVGDRDSVRTYDNRLLCYICARNLRYNRYYDDDLREFNEEDNGEYPWNW
jgi:hypothetical protein